MKNLLILNQYFPPDQAATGQLLGQLAEALSEKYRVTVICGSPTYAPDPNAKRDFAPLKIHRVPLLPTSRRNLPFRILNYFLFLAGALFLALRSPAPDVVICWTDPPPIGLVGALVRKIKGSRFLFVSQDVYPEIMRAAGKMNHPLFTWLLARISRVILNSADRIVAVGSDMKARLLAKGVRADRIRVIPNWQDLSRLSPRAKVPFRREAGIDESVFVVMHSGNLGLSQDFETLLGAAGLLRDDPSIAFVIIGDGAKERELKGIVARDRLSNVKILPYQPENRLADSLSAADVHYVSLKPDFLGLVVPSKIYGILAVGRPVIANVPANSEVATVLKSAECGTLISPDSAALRSKILHFKENRDSLDQMGKNGRVWIGKNGGKEAAIQRYEEELSTLTVKR